MEIRAQASLVGQNGGTEPYPIPWLDKNGSPINPPDRIGILRTCTTSKVLARASTFSGMSVDNNGNRIAFGAPTTDYGLMQGEYWAG